jgi:hypothetical protein
MFLAILLLFLWVKPHWLLLWPHNIGEELVKASVHCVGEDCGEDGGRKLDIEQ